MKSILNIFYILPILLMTTISCKQNNSNSQKNEIGESNNEIFDDSLVSAWQQENLKGYVNSIEVEKKQIDALITGWDTTLDDYYYSKNGIIEKRRHSIMNRRGIKDYRKHEEYNKRGQITDEYFGDKGHDRFEIIDNHFSKSENKSYQYDNKGLNTEIKNNGGSTRHYYNDKGLLQKKEYVHNLKSDSITKEWINKIETYRYNDISWITIMEYDLDNTEKVINSFYTYNSYDNYNNWIDRTIKMVSDNKKGEDKSHYTFQETRKIYYWDILPK